MSTRSVYGVVLCVGLLLPGRAKADDAYTAGRPYVSVQAGALAPLGYWDLSPTADNPRGTLPAQGPHWDGGAQLGWQLHPRLAVEGGLTVLPVLTTVDTRSTAMSYEVDALYHLTGHEISSYLFAGVNAYHAVAGELASDFDPGAHGGLGVRALIASNLALRGELRLSSTDGLDGAGGNIGFRLGVDLIGPGKGPPDADGDGVADENDACPAVAGAASAQGCPDADGDGVVDAEDSCPSAPGRVADGCPDTDGDGIIDKADRCPAAAGLEQFEGCPDSDGDNVPDATDECPTEPGRRGTAGCPDQDRDGVADKADKCPDVRGLKSHDGCVPEEVEAFTGAIEGIRFQSGSSVILSRSHSVLDSTVAIMESYPGLRLRIEGHTDNQGDADYNLQLSKERAAAVVAYMVEKGVAVERLVSEGYGMAQPAASNDTANGRAQNRRIEFTIVEQ